MDQLTRERNAVIWEAREGISKFTKAMERLQLDYGVDGASDLWDEGLELWQQFTVLDEQVFAQTRHHTFSIKHGGGN